jgi:hypothetical protein
MKTNEVFVVQGEVTSGSWIMKPLSPNLIRDFEQVVSPFVGRVVRVTMRAELVGPDTLEENPELVALREEVARLRDRIVKANLALMEAGE